MVLLLGIVGIAVLVAVALGPIPQDPAYHRFADTRPCGPLPNCLNVLSNLPFLLLGVKGLTRLSRYPPELRPALAIFWGGVFGIGIGSSWYHLAPDDARLALDRLPMAVAFMGLFAAILQDELGLGRGWLVLLVGLGIGSVLYWRLTGDLRLYGLVQFLPPLLIVALSGLFPPGRLSRRPLLLALLLYGLAKGAELLDRELFELTGGISGHTLKHLLSALAAACLLKL